VISFSEELFKYLVVKFKVLNSHHLDEPLDVMLYMVVAALGFTAVENILYIFTPMGSFSLTEILNRTLILSFVRFVGATFLHTLCSAVIGYAVAISLCDLKNRRLEASIGIITAVVLHGLYDFSIITLKGNLKIIIPITILIVLAILTSLGFEKLKKLKALCKLN
jgi:RsiW-degrading membrane proteinase PrsW (M82 family)